MNNIMNAIQDGYSMPEMKERLAQLAAKKELFVIELREMEKSNSLEEALEKESLSIYLKDLGDLVQAGRGKAPEELQEMLRHFIRVTFNACTKEGTIAILLPLESEKPLKFSVADNKWFLKSNRSGQI